MAITALPTPPSRQDPTNFAVRADSFLGALPTFATEANALATELNGFIATSSASATAAGNSAAAAASSASAAASSALSAAGSFDAFDDRYLGSKTSDPAQDNDNSALLTGALYWNSTASEMRVWSGTSWVALQTTSASIAAAASASAASTSAASAATSASSASTSATAAANSFDSFDDRYLGAKASTPTTDNDGNTLLVGALFWNTLTNQMMVWDSTSWVSVQTTSASTAAAASASAAATSASAAATSAAAAAASLDSFDDRYLGVNTSNPITDNDGNTLLVGALYWNSTANQMRVWTGTAWVAAQPLDAVTSFNGRAGAVSLTATDIQNAASGNTVAFTNITAASVSATDINSTSDKTLKTNVKPLDDAPEAFDKLQPVSYNWIADGRISYGLLAQDAELLFPELVSTDEHGIKHINYIPFIAMLMARVRVLSNRIQQLENK